MQPEPYRASERALERLADLMRVQRVVGVTLEEDARARDRVLRMAFDTATPHTRRNTSVRLWAAAAVVLLVGVTAGYLTIGDRSLEYAADVRGSTVEGSVTFERARETGSVRFSDGSHVELGGTAQARVVEVDGRGAHIALDRGKARFSVVHRPKTRWRVSAGPYEVEVTGTQFDLDFQERDSRLVLALHDGSVVVRGPQMPNGVRLAAGQQLVATGSPVTLQISGPADAAVEPATPDLPAQPERAAALSPPDPPSQVSGRARSWRAPSVSWSERVRGGEYARVVAEAHVAQLSALLALAPLNELVALADAARYTRERNLARRAFEAQRLRFPRSSDGRNAAFMLGRIAEDQGQLERAVHLYDAYLQESPGGTFFAEALGRKLVATQRTRGVSAAYALASEYLARFPGGAYASHAREILQAR